MQLSTFTLMPDVIKMKGPTWGDKAYIEKQLKHIFRKAAPELWNEQY